MFKQHKPRIPGLAALFQPALPVLTFKKSRSSLFCKSFTPDLARFKILARSIHENNSDNLPFYAAVPRKDIALFRREVPGDIRFIAEEDFTERRCFSWLDGWRQQQVVKLSFHRLDLCERYLWLDSDSYFIKPFSEADLFGNDNKTPIVVTRPAYAPGQRDKVIELQLGTRRKSGTLGDMPTFSSEKALRVPHSLLKDKNYKNFPPEAALPLIPYSFGRRASNDRFEFLPPPCIFSQTILSSFEDFLKAEGLTFTDLIHLSPWEVHWYGNFALKYFSDILRPIEPLFMFFDSTEFINEARAKGVTRDTIRKNYLGITMAARHQEEHEF